MRSNRLSPITRRIVLGFLFSSVTVLVSITLIKLAFDYRAAIAQSRIDIDTAVNFTAPPASRALWNYDLKQLESELAPIVKVPLIVRAVVLDDRNQIVLTVAQSERSLAIEDVVTRPLPGSDNAGSIGTLKLYISNEPMRAKFWLRAQQEMAMDFFEIVILASLLFYLLHRNVISQLIGIVRGIENLDHANATDSLVLERTSHPRDEVDQLVDAINKFHREVVSEREARQQVELQSHALGDELTRMGRVATVQSLTTTIAHELNQPLAAILSNAETIELTMFDKLSLDDPLREILADIATEARRAGQIIHNLRNLTQKREVQIVPLNINSLMREVVELASLDMRWESIRLELKLESDLPMVMGSAVQLQQVLLNLIANARDAIKQSEIANGFISIETKKLDSRWLQISVTDNGPGIQAEKMDSIFKPFFTTKNGGTGMGLWIAQMIIEQHGGKLDVRNEARAGTRFSFSLPVQVQ